MLTEINNMAESKQNIACLDSSINAIYDCIMELN